MSCTLLQLVTDFTDKWNLPTFSGIIGSTDATVKQIRALIYESLEDLSQYPWQNQQQRVTFTSIAGETQGTLAEVFGAGYRSLIPGTFWDDTERRPLFGPVGDISWQMFKAFTSTGPIYQYKIMGGNVLITPTMVAGHTLSALIASIYAVRDASGSLKARPTADNDTFLYPDNVFKAELEWRWLKQKGEPWAASQERARELIALNINKDSSAPTLWMDKTASDIKPGLWVPAGNWNV